MKIKCLLQFSLTFLFALLLQSTLTGHPSEFGYKDIIPLWKAEKWDPEKLMELYKRAAARKEGLKFGVSEHPGASYTWFQAAHLSDTKGPEKGVPCDGANPDFRDLYHPPAQPGDNKWLTNNLIFQIEWYSMIKELIDNYHPDLLYSDSQMPFGDVGRSPGY